MKFYVLVLFTNYNSASQSEKCTCMPADAADLGVSIKIDGVEMMNFENQDCRSYGNNISHYNAQLCKQMKIGREASGFNYGWSKLFQIDDCSIKCEIVGGFGAPYILPLKIFGLGLCILVCALITKYVYKRFFSMTTNPPSEVDDENDFVQYQPTQTQYSSAQFSHTQYSPRQLAPILYAPAHYATDEPYLYATPTFRQRQ